MLFEVLTSIVRKQRTKGESIYEMKGCELVGITDKTNRERKKVE